MPVDLTGVKPLGTLTRHPLDWYSDAGAMAGYQLSVSGSTSTADYLNVSIYNNDNAGKVARVYGAYATSDGGTGMQLSFLRGFQGTLVGQAQNLRPDYPAPSIFTYQLTVSVALGSPNPNPPGPIIGAVGTSGFDSSLVMSPFPIAIIPVGWSLVAWNVFDSGQTGFFCWFQMANK